MVYSQENGSYVHFQNSNQETMEDKRYRKKQICKIVYLSQWSKWWDQEIQIQSV